MQIFMRNKTPIKERMLEYLDYKGITKYRFYKESGVSRGVLDKKSGIGEENIARFIAYAKDINLYWLILGIEPMLQLEISSSSSINESVDNDSAAVSNANKLSEQDLIAVKKIIIDLRKEIDHKDKLLTTQDDLIGLLKKEIERLKRTKDTKKQGYA